jgi:hypothetical protein
MTRWFKWTKEMDRYLLDNYEWMGDKRLAELFSEKFPKHYPWTNKHIEKRRGYLGLRRTKEQESIIRIINNWDGRHAKAWDTRGRCPEGTVKEWKGRKYIKVNNRFVLHARHISKARRGQIARTFEGGLQLITHAENAILNNRMRAAMPPEIKQAVKALNQLKKIIHAKEN